MNVALHITMYLRKKYPQETQNMPDGTIGFQHINEKWFKKLEGHKLSLVKAKNNVIEGVSNRIKTTR